MTSLKRYGLFNFWEQNPKIQTPPYIREMAVIGFWNWRKCLRQLHHWHCEIQVPECRTSYQVKLVEHTVCPPPVTKSRTWKMSRCSNSLAEAKSIWTLNPRPDLTWPDPNPGPGRCLAQCITQALYASNKAIAYALSSPFPCSASQHGSGQNPMQNDIYALWAMQLYSL